MTNMCGCTEQLSLFHTLPPSICPHPSRQENQNQWCNDGCFFRELNGEHQHSSNFKLEVISSSNVHRNWCFLSSAQPEKPEPFLSGCIRKRAAQTACVLLCVCVCASARLYKRACVSQVSSCPGLAVMATGACARISFAHRIRR